MSRLFFRNALLEAKDSDKGIVKLCFASEKPVLRRDKAGKYWEVLSHAAGDANLGLLNRAGMVLQDHDEKQEIGDVVKNSAKVYADKKTRAEIQIFDGLWLNRAKSDPADIPVSVGYNRLSMLRELASDAEGIVTRFYSWRPYEISLLTVEAADDSAGIGRSNKRQCADCGGNGRCRCRAKDDDEADDDCKDCGGNGKCSDCGGDGYFESARSKSVDSLSKLSAKDIEKELTEKQKRDMKNILFKADSEDGNGTVIEADVRKDERAKAMKETGDALKARAKEITSVADTHIKTHGTREFKDGDKTIELREKISALAGEYLQNDEGVDKFKIRCLEVLSAATEPKQVRANDFVSKEEMAQFSVVRAIQSAVKSREKGMQGIPDEKELEGGIIKEYSKRCAEAVGGMGYEPQGFVVPSDAQFGTHMLSRSEMKSELRRMQNRYGRDMQATLFGAGGAVVPTYWMLPVIELLRNKTVLNRVGMRTMSGLTGNVILPRLEAPSTAYSVAEIQAVAASQQVLGQLTATPHRVAAEVDYSKQLIFQSSPDIENLIRDDMFQVLAIKRDALGLNGQGANSEPLGIFNTPGIGSITFGATPTYIKMVLFETLIRQQNVMGRLAYASTSATKGSLKTVAEALTGATTIGGSQNAIWKGIGGDGEEDGMVNGYQAIDSQQIPNNQVLAGMFGHFIELMWGGLDIVVDYFTKASNAEVRVIMNLWIDFLARHPQAFCASTDAGNQ